MLPTLYYWVRGSQHGMKKNMPYDYAEVPIFSIWETRRFSGLPG